MPQQRKSFLSRLGGGAKKILNSPRTSALAAGLPGIGPVASLGLSAARATQPSQTSQPQTGSQQAPVGFGQLAGDSTFGQLNSAASGQPAPAPRRQQPTAAPQATSTSSATSAAPVQAPTQDSGFASTDPAVQQRVAEMTQQAMAGTPAATGADTSSGARGAFVSRLVDPADAAAARAAQQTARDKFLASLVPSEALTSEQLALEQFRGDTAQSIAGEEGTGRGITTGLVRGRQAQLQRQAGLEEQTRLGRIGVLQGDQQLAQQAAGAELGFAQEDMQRILDLELRQQEQNGTLGAPFEFGGNLVQYDPTTGQLNTIREGAATAGEGFTLGSGQARFDSAGNLIATGPASATDPLADRKKQLEIQKLEADLVESGSPYSAQLAERTVSAIDQALTDLSSVDSLGPLARLAASKVPGTDSFDFAKTLETIKANIGFNELNAMREASKTGGALGQVSEREIAFLQSVLGSLDLGQSNEQLQRNLGLVKESINRFNTAVKQEYGSGQSDPLIQAHPDLANEIQVLRTENNATDEEIRELLGLPNDLSTSQNGQVARIANAIGQFESGGNYQAVGPDTGSGNRAYGKYQVMDFNIPNWSREVLGQALTVEQFLNNPAAQDAIAQAKMGQYFNQYGTVEDVASLWFSGRPMAQAGNAQDVLGTSVPQYIQNVRSLFNTA